VTLVRRLATVAIWLVAVSATACSNRDVVPDALMSIGVANGTSIPVRIVVNGVEIRTVEPLALQMEIPASALPPLPWQVEATTMGGRTLVALLVRSGDVHVTANGRSGVGQRVDLSCGRLDIWSGPPMSGPMPGPGLPGDCD
jgi:hypothetical protein